MSKKDCIPRKCHHLTLSHKLAVGFQSRFPNWKPTSIKCKVECDKWYLCYIELGGWLCSHFQLKTLLNFHKLITQKL